MNLAQFGRHRFLHITEEFADGRDACARQVADTNMLHVEQEDYATLWAVFV